MAKKQNNIEIIHQDENLLVINKPGDISVTKDRSGKEDILTILARQLSLSETDELRLIHRLDKATSGVMLIAKNKETQSTLSSMFEKRMIQKTYLAFVSGFAHKDEGQIKTPIAPSRKNPGTMCVDPRHGKPAITKWKLLADFGQISLVMAKPLTGRTHQIRLHMKSIGIPLAIDPVYGSNKPICLSDFKTKYRTKKGVEERPLIERLTLHAYQITIPENDLMKETTFIAPMEKNFAAAFKMLTKHNPMGDEAFSDPSYYEKILNAEKIE